METIYENLKHPELNVMRIDAETIEGSGVIAKDVGVGFLLKISMPGSRQEIFLDNTLLEAMYNQMKANGN